MYPDAGLTVTWFVAASSLVVLVFLLVGVRKSRVDQRLQGLEPSGGTQSGLKGFFASGAKGTAASLESAVSPVDRWTSRRMRQEEKKQGLRDRIEQAGLYKPQAVGMFVGVRIFLLILPAGLGVVAARMGMMTMVQGIVFGVLAGGIGTLAPSFWLDHVKRSRQTKIRRALPDALDVLVVCLEGGLSVPASFSRVARELATAHPMLAVEFQIVERQSQMGRSTGEAVREFAKRFDLEELRSMASVIVQAEKIGSSVVGALEVFAETLREKRSQRAEELAQKAAVKILFPTLLFIFPGIFVVILGPAAIQIYTTLFRTMRGAF